MHLRKEALALLVVDIQDGLLPHIDSGERVVATASKLCKVARQLNIPILVTEQAPAKLGSTNETVREAAGNAPTLDKVTFSCMGDQGIRHHLNDLKCRQIILCGMETHICVALTARDLLEEGYEVAICSDGVSSRDAQNHKAALKTLRSQGAWVMPFETLAYDLMEQAGTPDFKALLHLFK